MNRLRVLRCVVPEVGGIVGVGQVGRRVALLSVDLKIVSNRSVSLEEYTMTYEVRELGWVPQKEDGCVVGDNIPVTLLSSELDRETTRITSAVVRARLTTDSRESDCDRASLALLEDVC